MHIIIVYVYTVLMKKEFNKEEYIRVRLFGRGDTVSKAQDRKRKVLHEVDKLGISAAQVIRNLIDYSL